MQRIYSHIDGAMVHLAQNELERSGIPSVVRGQHLANIVGGGAGIDAWTELWLLDGDRLAEAEGIISRLIDEQSAPEAQPWICPSCGETVDGEFALCWNCAAQPAT